MNSLIKNIVNLVIGIIISLLLNSCITASLVKSTYLICRENRVKIYDLPEENPTYYIINYSKKQVVDFILINKVKFKGYNTSLLHKANEIDTIIFDYNGSGFKGSYIYRHPKGYGKRYYYKPIVEVSALSDTTSLINVTMKDPELYVGLVVMFYPIFYDHLLRKYEITHPTTIEEYEIIRYIGRSLGEKGMPKVKYPPQLTKWEIKTSLIQAYPEEIYKKKYKSQTQEEIDYVYNKKIIDLILGDD